MPTQWTTAPVELGGGLITNISPLQQGIKAPGSARQLINFEPSIEGGYRRIEGYTKYDDAFVPPYGESVVQGSGQTGTSLVIANIFSAPQVGDTFTIESVAGEYEITSLSYVSSTNTATLTLATSLDSSPADQAAITFSNRTTDKIDGLMYFKQKAIAYRNGDLWESEGSGWTRINTPDYGTVLVDGGSQTGTTLDVDGLTATPQIGDTFTVAGIEKVYTITNTVTVSSGAASITISPALASSPADNAAVTFLSVDRSSGGKHRFVRYNFLGTSRVCVVDGTNNPFKYDGTTFTVLNDAPTDVLGADHVAEFKSHLFFSKGNTLTFTAPYTDDNFDAADGAGVITVPHTITGLIVFREQLIIFSTSKIHRLVGNTIADFQLQPISLDIGCIREDTIQEVGGDIAFLGPDGIRLLNATDRIGDFGLAVASRPIQSETNDLVSAHTSFNSCVVRSKSQYRIFGYTNTVTRTTAKGILGTQFADQTAQGMAWAETRGILVNIVDSVYSNADSEEVIIFANRDGYVYRMESGNSFDNNNIVASFYTPYFSFGDPRIRKTFYKLTTYLDPEGSISGSVTPKLDFDETTSLQPEPLIQPQPVEFDNEADAASFYGSATYGSASFGGNLQYVFINQLIGSGFTFSLQYQFDSTDPPFSLDALAIELASNDRQ
jgi:hypothetical protein